MKNITPGLPKFTINSQGVAAVLNCECKGEIIAGGGTLRFVSTDGQWEFKCPVAFGGFVAPGEGAIFSITCIKNAIMEAPLDVDLTHKIIKPGNVQ